MSLENYDSHKSCSFRPKQGATNCISYKMLRFFYNCLLFDLKPENVLETGSG